MRELAENYTQLAEAVQHILTEHVHKDQQQIPADQQYHVHLGDNPHG